MRRLHDSLVRGFWRIMAFDGFGADSFFGDEFYGWAEEVVEESPFLGIEVVNPSSWFLSKKRVVFEVSKNVYLNILAC